jgi:hypothetical protein
VTGRVVASLEIEPSFEGLAIRDPGFGFDAKAPRGGFDAANLRIPGPEVTFDPERNLGSPSKSRVQTRSQPLQQGELGAVADRIARRVGADDQIETNDRTPCPDVRGRYALQ